MAKLPREQYLLPVSFAAVNFTFFGIKIHDFEERESDILQPIFIVCAESFLKSYIVAMPGTKIIFPSAPYPLDSIGFSNVEFSSIPIC
ncbi:Uncharacterised protein [Klebsiella quasipneumoniae]|nr:Uncharacterised protein [Klebsiella quasipneumoniae]